MADLEPGQVGEELPDGSFTPVPRSEEIDALTDDALEKAIQDSAVDFERERQRKAVAIMAPKLTKEEIDEVSGDTESQDAPEVVAEGSETDGQKQEAEATGDISSRELREELELQRLRAEKLEAEVKRSTYQRDNLAGEMGHLKSLLSKQRSAPETEPVYRDQEADTQPEMDEDRRELRDELSNFRKERVQGVVQSAAAHFEANVMPSQVDRFTKIWGAEAAKDLQGKMYELVKLRAPEFADELNGTNPKRAQLAVETILKSSLADAQIELIESRREAVQRERDAQAEKLKARKQDSDMAGKGRVAPRTARAKTADELTDEELERAVQRSVVHEVSSRGR